MTKELFRQAAQDIVLPKLDVSELEGVTPLQGPQLQ